MPEFVAEDHETVGVVEVGGLDRVDGATVVAGCDRGASGRIVEAAERGDFFLGAPVHFDGNFCSGCSGCVGISRKSSIIRVSREGQKTGEQ